MLYEQLLNQVKAYVNRKAFQSALDLDGKVEVSFLAQGEYNLNYLLENKGRRLVLRINTASQMQLDNQIAYEYQALQLLETSGVTPRPYYLDDKKEIIPFGILVMEYLPGEPLDYNRDLSDAARTFAAIHSLQIDPAEAEFLVKDSGPFTGIFNESSCYLEEYFKYKTADPETKKLLEKVQKKAEVKKQEEKLLLEKPWLAVINTEVNSHNFIVNRKNKTCHLIDWEKPIYGEPAQDLSMFLIATTTLWKRNYRLNREEENDFIKIYKQNMPSVPNLDNLEERVEMFKFFNYLRAISWCAMAWTEYTKPGRPLVNQDTFEKIKMYIAPDFIKSSFPQVFNAI